MDERKGARHAFIVAIATFVVPMVAAEAPKASWENLNQLSPGQKIQVVQMDLKSQTGRFLACSDEGIRVSTNSGEITLAREDVLRVTLQQKSHRLRNALIGAAVGGAAGVAIGAATVDKGPDESGEGNIGKALFGLIGTGAGAGVGAAIPGHPTVYRAQRRGLN